MSKFIMKNRPKKPSEPQSVHIEVGDRVSLGYLNECVERFKVENPGLIEEGIHLELMENWYEGYSIFLTAPPESYNTYHTKLNLYKAEMRAYKAWQKKNKNNIEKCKAMKKKATAKRKLENTMVRLTKELEDAETKLKKA